MISLNNAIQLVNKRTRKMQKNTLPIEDALGYVTSKNILSPINFPLFEQSAMDGYAVCKNSNTDTFLLRKEEIKAGDNCEKIALKPGEAIRIFTGAMVPVNTDYIAKQEDVFLFDNKIKVIKVPTDGANIRRVGEQTKIDSVVIKKGSLLNPGAIGYLAMLGIREVPVYSKPEICLITTGNELLSLDQKLSPGKIYESNSYTLIAALKNYGFKAYNIRVEDNYQSIKSVFEEQHKKADLILFTGGISVGDYDFVGRVLSDLGVETIFYKVKQKPGKPLFFGELSGKMIFGLPGNPAASLTSLYLYVLPCLAKMIGRQENFITKTKAGLMEDYEKSSGITHLLKAQAFADKVELLPAQSSAMLSSFVNSNCIAVFEESKEKWKKGEEIEIWII